MKAKSLKLKYSFGGRNNQLWGIFFVLPFWIGAGLFLIKMLVMGIRFAFSDINFSGGMTVKFAGIKNFHYIFRVDPNAITMILGELKSLLVTLPIILVFSLFVAVLLNSDIKGRTVFRAIFFLPVIVCTGLISSIDKQSLVMEFMSDSANTIESSGFVSVMGDITEFLQGLNFSPELISIVSGMADNIMEIVNLSGVQILFFLAGIQSISPQLYEAAHVEGASSWEIFWKITLPSILPTMVVNVIYTLVEYLTRDDTALYEYVSTLSFEQGLFGYGSAAAWFYFLCIVVLMGLIFAGVRICSNIAERSRKEEYL